MSNKFKLGVAGNPIEHSLSPFIHSRFAKQEKINLSYMPYRVEPDNFNGFVTDFFSDPLARGLNITLPLKNLAAQIAGNMSEEAKHLKAVNTITKIDGILSLDSTDGVGFMEDLRSKNIDIAGKNILILGAGAAVQSILYKLLKGYPNTISILNRSQDKAETLVNKYVEYANLGSSLKEDVHYDLIINGSSAGLTGEFIAPEGINFSSSTCFYDLNYSLESTPFCSWAKEHSSQVFDGVGMLVYQAAQSFKLWFGKTPSIEYIFQDIKNLNE
jgi:shikimate dehydrogenase